VIHAGLLLEIVAASILDLDTFWKSVR